MTSFTDAELEQLLSAVVNPQHRAFLMLGYYHGARRGELLSLTGADIQNGHVTITRLKRRRRFVSTHPLHPIERGLVERLAGEAGLSRLFPWSASKASHLVQSYLRDLGIYTSPYQKALHSLRHSCGRRIYRSSNNIVDVATYLGHANIESARRYVHADESEVSKVAIACL